MKRLLLKICLTGTLLLAGGHACAQSTTSAPSEIELSGTEAYIYEKPTFEKMSQLYWALDAFNIKDDWAVDNYMQINECEIFQKNRANEFEWREIREAARAYIEKNIQNFPIRFEIVQPLRLSEYDFEQQAYKIWEPYQVDSVRMFEVLSAAYGHGWCGSSYEIKGYPKGLVFEFTRPLSITHIKMTPEEAKQFSETKMRGLPSGASTKAVYNSRDAYLVMNIKAYGYKGILKEMQVDPKAKILAALESYSIYADKDRQNLMFSETLRRKEGGKSAEEMLKNRVLENREKERLKEEKRKQKEAERKAQEEEVQEAKNKKSKR